MKINWLRVIGFGDIALGLLGPHHYPNLDLGCVLLGVLLLGTEAAWRDLK